ncbi:laccase [Mycena rosella]|uniref:Laccase n=1 Tax=Mycena rosella TaxID=1033263 RepID=A0AAD7DBY6_MYCRO|nr:laccase [Mycena rosella]
MMLFTASFIFFAISGTYAAVGPSASIEIVNKVVSPDGKPRSAVLANGVFPGPLITGQKGDHFLLDVVDKLTQENMLTDTSIHWHGLFQKSTNWADGPAWCPIATGHSFLYDFDVPDQAGTFWYHSHLSTQYCDGLRGPMVVYDPNDPAKPFPKTCADTVPPESTVITLSDWYHLRAFEAGSSPHPDSTLINGLGRYKGGSLSDLTIISVSHGTRYRLRLVSMSCKPAFNFSIDGHSMTVIEVDGVNHQPHNVDSIEIFAGQRYSVVLTANQLVSNYWIRAGPTSGTNQGFTNGTNSAILRYVGAPTHEPTTSSALKNPLVETALHPLVPSRVPGVHLPGHADVNLTLVTTFSAGRYGMNGSSFHPPTVPELLPKGSVYELPPNKVIEITLPGGFGAPLSYASSLQASTLIVLSQKHPFHLHGHAFHVVRSAGNATYNWDNPVIRNVVNAGSSGTTFRVLHCHIDWHFEL